MCGALFVVGLIAIVGMELQARSLRKSRSEVETMELTGRQRMLSQRLGRLVALSMADRAFQNEELRQRLRLNLEELNSNADRIYALMDEQIRRGANLQEVRNVFSAAREHREVLVKAVRGFDESKLETGSNWHDLALDAQLASDKFLEEIAHAESSLESYSENRVNSDILQVYTMAGLLLAAIAFVGLFIIEPAVQVLRKQHAQALDLQIEMERLASVAKLTTNAVVVTDANKKITWVNEGFTRISGYTI